MADRTVRVHLEADVAGYVAGMKTAARATDDLIGSTEKGTARLPRSFEKAGTDSGKALNRGVKKWLVGDGQRLFSDSGRSAGTVFGSGFLGVLKTPVLGPAVVAALTAGFVTVMPAVGAAAAGGLVTGMGAGLAGLGLLFAAQSDDVQRVWSKTMSDLGDDMRLLSEPFEDTLIGAAGVFRRTVRAFEPEWAKAFKSMPPHVEAFVDETGRALEQLIPLVGPTTSAFEAVLDTLGPATSDAIGEVADELIRLADSVRENPEALADVVRGVGELSGDLVEFIAILNDVNAAFEDLTGGASLVDVTFGGLRAILVPLQGLFAGIHTSLDILNQDWGSLAQWSG